MKQADTQTDGRTKGQPASLRPIMPLICAGHDKPYTHLEKDSQNQDSLVALGGVFVAAIQVLIPVNCVQLYTRSQSQSNFCINNIREYIAYFFHRDNK